LAGNVPPSTEELSKSFKSITKLIMTMLGLPIPRVDNELPRRPFTENSPCCLFRTENIASTLPQLVPDSSSYKFESATAWEEMEGWGSWRDKGEADPKTDPVHAADSRGCAGAGAENMFVGGVGGEEWGGEELPTFTPVATIMEAGMNPGWGGVGEDPP
jgi:hypothetical protein